MKITKRQLRRIIREEQAKTEKYDDDPALVGDQADELPDPLQRAIIAKAKKKKKKNESSRITRRQLHMIIKEELHARLLLHEGPLDWLKDKFGGEEEEPPAEKTKQPPAAGDPQEVIDVLHTMIKDTFEVDKPSHWGNDKLTKNWADGIVKLATVMGEDHKLIATHFARKLTNRVGDAVEDLAKEGERIEQSQLHPMVGYILKSQIKTATSEYRKRIKKKKAKKAAGMDQKTVIHQLMAGGDKRTAKVLNHLQKNPDKQEGINPKKIDELLKLVGTADQKAAKAFKILGLS